MATHACIYFSNLAPCQILGLSVERDLLPVVEWLTYDLGAGDSEPCAVAMMITKCPQVGGMHAYLPEVMGSVGRPFQSPYLGKIFGI